MAENNQSTISAVLITGLLALFGTIGGSVVKGFWDKQLADQKLHSTLLTKALESDSASERLASLEFMVETGLIKDEKIEKAIKKYIVEKKSTPEKIPQIRSDSQKLAAPIIKNSRIYLLAGDAKKSKLLSQYTHDLVMAGFNIIGSKKHNDSTRPNKPEIRYFYHSDATQANHLAEYFEFSMQLTEVKANYYVDSRVEPGYIEVWLGR